MEDINEQLDTLETLTKTTTGPMWRSFMHAETLYAYLSFASLASQDINLLIHFAELVGEEHWA
tara:strand:- start:457 stop:645 length:189 start_codon:yes stop_codon:yes gene_type:complete